MTYQKCDDTYAFTLDAQAATIAAAAAQTGTMCTGDYLEIVGATKFFFIFFKYRYFGVELTWL